jgi:hypothetical protein
MKKIILIIMTLSFIISLTPTFAKEITCQEVYLGDGIYVETIIEESEIALLSLKTKTGSKTNKYKDSNGTVLYTLTVSGVFTYTGSSSTCISSSTSTTVSSNNWTVISNTSSKSGNKATAKEIYNQYLDGRLVQTKTCNITLTRSATGSLS